ncbi:MAG: glycoside-pentoside-hexuronide (GPH):cation symporter [Oscillospiraceae bacterium]|nr:glycoside-pentoside-hexuronide (GPH):cation symporter [Oscillospiraceae bacterium]
MNENNSTHGIKAVDKIGYALGDMGGILTFSLVNSFLTMFYTDVLGIANASITVLMLVARIWDAVNDPMWGAFIDSRRATKYGRFRPYILFASIPLAISAFLMFFKIPGLTERQYLIYAYFTYIFYGMMYTGVNIPYGSLASVITDDTMERSSLSMWRSVGAGVGGLPAQILLPMFVYTSVIAADGKTIKVLDGNKLSIAVLCLSLLTVVTYFVHFKLTKERVAVTARQSESKYSLIRSMQILLKNKPFIALCVVSMLLICFQMYTQTVYNYLFKNYFQKPGLYGIVTICTYLPMALFLPVMSKLVARFGKKEICCAGIAFSAVINIIMYLLGFTALAANPYLFLVMTFLSGAGQTFLVLEVWAMVMDVIDYHELLSGRREESTAYSFYSFVRKLGQTAAGAGVPAILALIGYNGKLSVQPAGVTEKLYGISTLVPAVILSLLFAVLFFCYKLSKKEVEKLGTQLRETRNAN